jgi:hypothetical protein
MMTKKHFETLAGSIEKLARTQFDLAYEMANDISDACEKDNPRFDRGRFFEACGLGGVHFRVVPVEYVDAD